MTEYLKRVTSEGDVLSYQVKGLIKFIPVDAMNTDYVNMLAEGDAGTSTMETVEVEPPVGV